MSDFLGKLKTGAGKVTFEAEKLTRLNHAKGELEKLKNQVQEQFGKLGELYFAQHATGVTGPAFAEIVKAITDLQAQVEAKTQEIQKINAETFAM